MLDFPHQWSRRCIDAAAIVGRMQGFPMRGSLHSINCRLGHARYVWPNMRSRGRQGKGGKGEGGRCGSEEGKAGERNGGEICELPHKYWTAN